LAIHPDGLYCSTEEGRIIEVSWSGDVEEITSGLPRLLSNITINNNGNIIVGNLEINGTNELFEVSPTGQKRVISTSCITPTDITINKNGNFLVMERIGIRGVSEVAPDGSWRNVLVNSLDYGWTGHPTGIEIDNDGTTYIAYRDVGKIYAIPKAGNPYEYANVTPSGSLITLCFAPDGTLFAANDIAGEIYKISSIGTVSLFASNIINPHYMKFDGKGAMYVAAYGEDVIYKIVPEPATLILLGLGGFILRRSRKA